jgi:hypothetical protein
MYECMLERVSIPIMFLNLSYLAILKCGKTGLCNMTGSGGSLTMGCCRRYCLSAFYCYEFVDTYYGGP